MHSLLDLERYPIDRPNSPEFNTLVARCRIDLVDEGMFNLEGLLRPDQAQSAADTLKFCIAESSYTHSRLHNIYFKNALSDLPKDHPALMEFHTINHTLCADQLADTVVARIYQWAPLAAFLALTMGKEKLFTMDDPLAKINVMAYYEGRNTELAF